MFSFVQRAGGVPVNLGIARDTPESLRKGVSQATDVDFIVTTAGISVGTHDHVRPVIESLDGEIRFWRLPIRPGAPVGFGMVGDTPWLGLPGNPVSTMVTFELFARPAIRRLAGHPRPFRRTVKARVGEPITLGPPLRHFLRVVLDEAQGELVATRTGPQGAGILMSMVRAAALLIVPEDRPEIAEGDILDAIVLDDPQHVAEPPF